MRSGGRVRYTRFMRKRTEWMMRWGSTAAAVVVAGAMVFCAFGWTGILRTRGYAALFRGSVMFVWWDPPLHVSALPYYFQPRNSPNRWAHWFFPCFERKPTASDLRVGPSVPVPTYYAQTSLSVPLVYALLPAATASCVLWRRRCRSNATKLSVCAKCRYDLRGVPARDDGLVRCPECGRS